MDRTALRVVAYHRTPLGDSPATMDVIRELRPDIVIVQGGPRRLRWRSRAADLGNRLGLLYAAGGEPSLGNVILVSMRVSVPEIDYLRYPLTPGRLMQGAAVIRACVAGRGVAGPGVAGRGVAGRGVAGPGVAGPGVAGRGITVAGTRLSPYADERPGQAEALAAALDRHRSPVVIAAGVGEAPGDPAWRRLARGRVAVGGDLSAREAGADSGVAAEPADRIAMFLDPHIAILREEWVPLPRVRTTGARVPGPALLVDLRPPA